MAHFGAHIHSWRVENRCKCTDPHYDALAAAAILRKGITGGDDWTPEEIADRKQKARRMIKYARDIREEAQAKHAFWNAIADCEAHWKVFGV